MPDSFGFYAWIATGDGKTLQEYGIETDEGAKTVTCWIPSETNQAFSVNWKSATYPTSSCGDVVIDGVDSGGKILRAQNDTATHGGIIISSTSSRPFIFSSLELTDDDEYRNKESCKDIGEIKLTVSEVIENGEGRIWDIAPNLQDNQKVHERDKKAMAHRVKFGDAKTATTPFRFVNVVRLARVVTFVFKYRSLDILRADGIAPPKPPPPEKPEARSPRRGADSEDSDDKEEDRKVYDEGEDDELKAALAAVEKVRSKRAAEGKLPRAKRAKVERHERGPVYEPGEIIDLTI